MASEAQDFELYAGNHKQVNITVTDANDAVVDLTGSTITWRAQNADASDIINKASTDSAEIDITDAVNGVFQVKLLPADTTGESGVYQHEAKLLDATANETTVTVGHMNVIATIL